MNHYQNLAALLLRIVGSAIAIIGVMGPLYTGIVIVFGSVAPTYSREQWAGSFIWAIIGTLLVVFAKQLGRLFGRGLG